MNYLQDENRNIKKSFYVIFKFKFVYCGFLGKFTKTFILLQYFEISKQVVLSTQGTVNSLQ